MSFEDNKQFWEEFILLYQEKTCLWDIKSKEYRNKQLKNAAYNSLIEKCKELFPNANKDFVIKKTSSLRASFRRQLRRISDAKKSGCGADDVPEATLWYFDLMLFLVDQEESRAAVSSLEEDNSNDDMQSMETDTSTQDSTQYLQLPSPETPTSITSSTSLKRSRNATSWTKKRDQFLDASLKVLNQEAAVSQTEKYIAEPQEITFGRNVGQQLQEVEQRQKIIAQKIISDVLFYAKLGSLTDFSQITLIPQPAPNQFSSYIPHPPETQQPQQQSHTNFPTTSAQSDLRQTIFLRQPEQQTFTDLTYCTQNQAATNPKDNLQDLIHFPNPTT